MKDSKISRRDVLIGSSALAAGAAFSTHGAVGRAAGERGHAGS